VAAGVGGQAGGRPRWGRCLPRQQRVNPSPGERLPCSWPPGPPRL